MPSSSDPEAPRGLPPGALLALGLAAFGSAFAMRLTDPLLPRLAQEFSVSLAQAAQVVTVFSMAYGLAQLLFGPLGDRFGKFRVIGWAAMACALASVASALAPGHAELVGARLAGGIAAAAIIPLSMAFIGDMVAYADRQPVLARFLVGQILGMSSGVVVGGLAADHLGWRLPFWGLAAWFVAIALTMQRVGRRVPRPSGAPATGNPVRRMAGEFAKVLSVPWARVVLATVFLEGACIFGAFAFIAVHLHTVFHLPLAAAGATLMAFGAGGILFAFGARPLVARMGETQLAAWGGAIVALALLGMAWAPAWWWAVPGCLAAGLGFYMLHNTLQTNATQMAPERRGAAVSSFACCFFLGQAIGVWLAGLSVTEHGTRPLMVVGALGTLVVGAAFGRLRARHSARALAAAA
ncbi:MFS transporter [Pseudorhodoferax sp. Leaf265]|jgi:predicted MFS family arabinose efflux permease|uniref:MFS transporter n=1 Tax=Pseudorhodoferax sp. Leaf265 TaxID=1736315 RepID=UPI0006F8665B|nr:MFS transporter [Pseudorhodoferax sp. Leaf265]KQP03183.1 transporter [Pseudorhodoferax sp. Leaf265]